MTLGRAVPGEHDAGRVARAPALVCILVAAVAAFAPTLGGAFVYDDHDMIQTNPRLTQEDGWARVFGEDMWAIDATKTGGSGFYRPLVVVLLRIVHETFGPGPFGFRLASLGLHLLATTFLFVVGGRLGLRLLGQTVAAALFALHPIVVQAVAWPSAISDPMILVFGLIAILLVDAAELQSRRSALVLAGFVYLAALLTLERALFLAVPIAAYPWVRPRGGPPLDAATSAPRRDRILLMAMLATAIAAVAILRAAVLGRHTGPSLELVSTLRTLPSVVQRYAQNLLAPWQLAMAYPEHRLQAGDGLPDAASLLVLGLVVAAAAWLAKGRSLGAYGVGSAAALFAPALALGMLPGYALVQDRYLYVPWAFLALALGELAEVTRATAGRATKVASGILAGGLAVSWISAFPATARQYTSDLALYEAAVASAPGNAHFSMNLSNERRRRGSPDPDCALLRRARAAFVADASLGDGPLLDYNLGNCELRNGRRDLALEAYDRAIEASHGAMVEAVANATLVRVGLGRLDEALASARRLAAQRPEDADAHALLGLVLLRRGEYDAARTELEESLRLDPANRQARALRRSIRP